MTDKENLISLIKNIQDYGVKNEYGVSYVCQFTLSPEEIADRLISHGVTVREMQKPLTLEEVFDKSKNVSDNVVWMEQKDEDGDMCVFPAIVSNFASITRPGTGYLKFLAWPRREYIRDYSGNKDYGKAWRCWAEKPTEEERKAAEWE